MPESNLWTSVTYGNGLFVAVAQSGTNRVMTSPDGITWTARNTLAFGWKSVAYGNGTFVVTANNGFTLLTSSDGITWVQRSMPFSNYSWQHLTYGNGIFVAFASGYGNVARSIDGIVWTTSNTSTSASWNSLDFGNGIFVAVADNYILTSIDGINWTSRTSPESNSWKDVIYGNGIFVAVADSGTNRVMTSQALVYSYDYTVNQANGGTYIDGQASVSLSSVTDLSGNTSASPTNTTFIIDTTGPTVALTYSASPAKAGTNTITATYSEAIVGTPTISINQPGTTDITNASMSGSGTTWTYDYMVNQANGGTYVDGIVIVNLSTMNNIAGAPASPPLNNTFIIDTTSPVLTYTYSSNPTKVGTEIITATYSEAISGTPTISIDQPGTTDISNAALTNVGASTWTTRTATTGIWNSIAYGNGLFVAVTGTATSYRVMTSTDGITWTGRTAAQANSWTSVTYGNGLFVAVSSDGTNRVMTSPDGITWTPRSAAAANQWQGVSYLNGKFVAVSNTGTNRIMTSIDGINWTLQTSPDQAYWVSVAYGNSTYVAVATYGTNRVYTSSDAVTWTPRTAAEANTWKSVTYGNGLFVAVSSDGTNRVMASPDGITWTARVATQANAWQAVTYANGIFVAVSNGGTNRVMTSADGISWSVQTAASASSWISIVYGNGLFVSGGGGSALMTSPAFSYTYNYTINQANGGAYVDGMATVSLPATTDSAGNPVSTPTANTFTIDTTGPAVALSYSKNPSGTGVNTITATYNEAIASTPTISINQPGSTDILNTAMAVPASVWTARTASEANSWQSITYGNGLFVAVSSDGTNRVMTSPDGITWTTRTAATSSSYWQAVTYGNDTFVAISYTSDAVMTSLDGITWTRRTASSSEAWISVTYGNGLFVAVANNTNKVMTSPDGITWTARTASASSAWRAITYGNGLFVAVGGGVMTSPDGINWTSRTAPAYVWSSITYGNGLFVSVIGGSSSIYSLTSSDGLNWVSTYIATGSLSSIVYNNGLFVAVGNNAASRVMTSTNGTTWTARTAAGANTWSSIIYGNGKFVAVSSDGTNRVMTSPAGYAYDYTISAANGSTYIDGNADVSLSSVNDLAGNASQAPTNATFEINTQPPTVAMSYSKTPAGVGAMTITATYSKQVTSTPTISIDQPGSTDISNTAMTPSGDRAYTYSYTVNLANGGTYIDGQATVSLSSVIDDSGSTSASPTNATFTIETVPPTAAITYSINHATKTGDSQVITATFNEPMADLPLPKIIISGTNTLVATDMTKVDSTHYTYTHTVAAGNGDATVSLSVGTDVGTNSLVGTPTSGATFSIDNIIPAGTITAICNAAGNGCTVNGGLTTPQQAYNVASLSGTATDETTLSRVDVSILDTNTNKYYDGTSFTSETEVFQTAAGTTTWSLDTTLVPLTIDHIYTVNAKPYDVALNTNSVSINFKFVNSPPVVTNVTATQALSGDVSVSYDVTDIESSQTTNSLFFNSGLTLSGSITDTDSSLTVSSGTPLSSTGTIMLDDEIISYTSKTGNTLTGLTRGYLNTTSFAHTNSAIYIYAAGATGTGIGLSNKGTGKEISWTARNDADGFEFLTGDVKVVANDGSAGSMIGSMSSPTFKFDAKKPSAVVTFDAGVAGSTNSAIVTIPMPTDISTVEYKISDDALTQTNPTDTGWTTITESTTILWSFDSDIEVKTLKYQWRDVYGNVSAEQTTSTHTPVPSSSFMVQDTSNITATPPYYDMYIGWQSTDETNFASYKLEYATSTDNATYSNYQYISDDSLTSINSNYYFHRSLNSNLYYRYRLGVLGTNGNISVRSNGSTTTKPDGVQNYGEGGGGSVASAPKVENVVVTQNGDKNVSLSYKLTDSSLAKKVSPTYESYLFYNIGITLPSNALSGNSLTLSDASKLKSSGHILINNEVISYSGKSGNTLTGIVRATWPTLSSSGRTTRGNLNFFSGTPVWILSNGTTPIAITDTTILTGQSNIISWNTYDEPSLTGNLFTNVGVKVLVHDNQDALSGPLSSQNDYSENGSLSTLDLTAPVISFPETTSTGDESVTPVVFTLNLARAYPLNTAVAYTLTGTATSADYTQTDGTATILAGTTSTTIELPIIDDTLKELDETIIVTLSSPTNATLGENVIYTYTITDNDNTSGVQFVSTSSEGLESLSPVLIPINLEVASGTNTTVDYVVSGTATTDIDYTLISGTATILAGETTTDISLLITNDILKEEGETIVITLSNPTNATLGSNTIFTYTILDDDLYPTLQFDQPTSEAKEDANTVNVPVSITAPYEEDVTFSYTVTGGTAEGDSVDYLLDSGTGTITAGETTTNIEAIIFDDSLSEETESFIITISSPTNAILGANTNHILSILDNEIAVTNTSGSNIKATSARIIWTTADYTNSLLEYGTVPPPGTETDIPYTESKTNSEKTLEHSVYLGNLTPSTTYYFKTTSVNLADETTVTTGDFTTTLGPVISAVSSGFITDTEATISWTTDIPATSSVTYSLNANLTEPLRTGSIELTTSHSIVLTNLVPGNNYYYLVSGNDESFNESEDANQGDYYQLQTGADQTPPIITDISVPVVTLTQAAITWTTNEPTDALVKYGTVSGTYDFESELVSVPLTTHLVTLNNLENNVTYFFVVTSADANGNSTTSEEQSLVTTRRTGSGANITIGVAQELYDLILAENENYKAKFGTNLDDPTISNVTVSDITAFGAMVSFETDKETIGFIKYGKDTNYGFIIADDSFVKNHSLKITGLNLGTEYNFRAKAIDKMNNMINSDNQKFTTLFLTEKLDELKKIENVEQFQAEIESTIESILPSLVPPFLDKPEVKDITESSATITFRTNIKAYPIVSYTPETNYDLTKTNPYDGEMSDTSAKDITHTLALIGLKPNTKYHVMAKAFSLPQVVGKGEDFTFTTLASKIRGSVIDIKKDSFNVVWNTDEPTSSIIEYKNLTTGRISRIVDDVKNSSHSIKVENLTPGTSYQINISGINMKGNLVEGGTAINVRTSTDNTAPTITNIKVESALIVGRNDRVQTIISWTTDEPSTSTVYYEEGSGSSSGTLANKQGDYELTKNHVVILTTLKPGTVYRFTVESIDDANNLTKPAIRTIITPKKTESIVDVIFKNFDETFNFINNVR